MTSDAIRRPNDSARPAPGSPGPSASEGAAPSPDESNASPVEPVAETTATMVDDAAARPDSGIQAGNADAIGSTEAVVPTETVTTAEAVAATQAAAADRAVAPRPARRERFATFTRQFIAVAIAVGLFVGGIALGSRIFQTTHPPPTGIPTGQVGTTADQPPAVTREFVAALQANNFDALRSSLQMDPHIDFTDEMQRFHIKQIDKVEVLGTHVAETRSATEILVQFKNDDGIPLAVNMVVLVDGGMIEGFR
jgi:hypothetical protein